MPNFLALDISIHAGKYLYVLTVSHTLYKLTYDLLITKMIEWFNQLINWLITIDQPLDWSVEIKW